MSKQMAQRKNPEGESHCLSEMWFSKCKDGHHTWDGAGLYQGQCKYPVDLNGIGPNQRHSAVRGMGITIAHVFCREVAECGYIFAPD